MSGSGPVFSGSYRDTGYLFKNSAYTCCHNCTLRNACPRETEGMRCTKDQDTCISCKQWNEHGCGHFVLDWGILRH